MKKEKKALATNLGGVLTAKLSEAGEPSKKVLKAITKAAEDLADKLTKLKKKEEAKAKEKSEKAKKKEAAKLKKDEVKAKKKGKDSSKKQDKQTVQPLAVNAPVETPALVTPEGDEISTPQTTASRTAPRSRTGKAASSANNQVPASVDSSDPV
ncbi:hypothetical protein [Tellurirhabdus rosea]|uniref:hypothetical protein n=1 Tax=Tellurirhabdus rosea TaxID=2674997 RepID=UPI00224D2C36|nr:hypothetical protein [Tellurirhabdus rosea]